MSSNNSRAAGVTDKSASKGRLAAASPEMLAAPEMKPPRRRRQPRLLAMAVALMVLGALGAVWAVNALGERVSVVAVAGEVRYGEVVESGDLVEAQIAADDALSPVPFSEVDELVGMIAATDLLPGTLLTRDQLTREQLPPDGSQLVGVAAPSGQLPATTLRARDEVLLVPVIIADGSGSEEGLPSPYEAIVVSVGPVGVNGTRVVDVLVDDRDAAAVASRSAALGLAIVLASRG